MDINEVKELLDKYNIKSLEELEYYLNQYGGKDECIDDDEVPLKKYCTERQCYEDSFVPDCRKIIEIYNKYFKGDIKSKKLFIEYLEEHTDRKKSSIENYMSCKSCNQQVQKSVNSSLKISDSDFKKDFCNNLNKKFSYSSLFGNDYISIKQFLYKEHEITSDSFEPIFVKEEVGMTKDEKKRLFDLTHVSKQELKSNLATISNIDGSNDYKMNLALAAFDRNLIEESYMLVKLLSKKEDFKSNISLRQLEAKILSSKQMDKEAINLLKSLREQAGTDIDAETNSLLAASIKREAFNDYEIYADEDVLISKLNEARDIYFSIYQLNHDYYPALNYIYLVSMLSQINNDNQLEENKKAFRKIWGTVNHKVTDWWSYVAEVEFLIILEEYKIAKDKLKVHFDELEDLEVSDFNVSSTIRQLKLYSKFYISNDLKEIITFLENIESKKR